LCVLVALVLTGCSSGTSARPVPAVLKSVLLTTDDLAGTGWAVSANSDDGVNGRCEDTDPLARASRAGIEFAPAADQSALLSEEIVSAVDSPAGKAKYASTVATFQTCSAGVGAPGSSVTVLDATVPKVGDEARGFSISIDDPADSGPGGYVLLSVSIVRDGRLVEVYVYSGGVEFEAFDSTVAAGVSRAHALR
jgi:hypothetical protein